MSALSVGLKLPVITVSLSIMKTLWCIVYLFVLFFTFIPNSCSLLSWENFFGQGYYFCQGTGASHDVDFDHSDVDASFFLTNLKAYYPPYTNWAQALIDMCDQKYKFTYVKSTIT